MILMSLDYLLFVIICLDPLDLHIQILRLGTKWSLPQRTGLIFVSRLTGSSPIVLDSSFWFTGSPSIS